VRPCSQFVFVFFNGTLPFSKGVIEIVLVKCVTAVDLSSSFLSALGRCKERGVKGAYFVSALFRLFFRHLAAVKKEVSKVRTSCQHYFRYDTYGASYMISAVQYVGRMLYV
jgi:hypothetical protein